MTTSTRSADATGLPDRRQFLSTIAGAGALGLPVLPAIAGTPGPIEALFAEHLRIEAACEALSTAAMDAEEHYEEPERPRWHVIQSAGRYATKVLPNGKAMLYLDDDEENVADLRAQAAKICDLETNSLGYYAAERAKTTLAKIEAWQAEAVRRQDACGLAAAVVAATLPAIAAIADTKGDAHLFDLGRKWEHLQALASEADRQLGAVSAAYDRVCPDVRPGALLVRPSDDLALRAWPEKRKGKPTGRSWYGPVDIETAEAALAALPANKFPGGNDPVARAKLARLREIVASYRSDRETRRAAWRSCGMEEAGDAASTAHDRYNAAALEIIHCPATTLAGALLKVRVAVHCFGDTLDEAEAQIDGVMEEMTTGEGVALSILKDLARMAEAGRLGGGHA